MNQILTVSGVHENVLRRLHAEHETPPAMLVDTLKRYTAYADAEACAEQILTGKIGAEWAGFVPRFMTELSGWPEGKAIEVFEGPGLSGSSIKDGYADALPADTLQISRQELLGGALPERVVGFLDEQGLRKLLGQWFSGDRQRRIEVLREQLAGKARQNKRRLFDGLYSQRERSTNPSVNLLKSNNAELSTSMAEELLAHAQPSDVQHLTGKKRVSLRLAEQAREAEHQLRLSRAYEGLYLDELHNADTLRLELHSMAKLPGWSADLRLEIREYSFDGALSDSIGPSDAPTRKVLIRSEGGQYEARDARDQQLHGADTLYAAVLHALPDSQRVALGFEIHDALRLEQAVKANPLGRQSFEPIVRENPVLKPAYDPQVMRLRGGMQGFAQQVPPGSDLHWRLRSLYPGCTAEQVDMLMTEFSRNGGLVHQRVAALEAEFNQLNRTLRTWTNSPTTSFRFTPSGMSEWQARDLFCKAIRQCWQRTGPEGVAVAGVVRPQALMLDNFSNLRLLLETLPTLEANFDHVTQLSLRNGALRDTHMSFLNSFRRVRYLNLQDNLLTAVPPVISDMNHLTDLFLNDNRIELDVLAVDRLKNLTQLRSLGLRGNPLKLTPNISRMPRLQVLLLNDTGLEGWPVGLFSQSRPRNIYIDLRHNPIRQIPEVAPGSFRAELLARTVISRESEWISAENLDTLKMYIESLGMDPERAYPPRGTMDSADWSEGLTERQWHDKQEAWNAVEDEFDSVPFFNEIRKLTMSADFKAGGAYQVDLTAKVWRMIEAMAENTKLRIDLFREAQAPTLCVDAGTQLFNAMGMQVLIHEAYALGSEDLIESRLLELAQGKSRLDELGAIARQRVAARLAAGERFARLDRQGNVSGTIDEVEVHLAYMTDLAQRLELPWQARGMQFRKIAAVSKEMIEAAFQRIVALEEGELLTDRILEQPLWETWLETTYKEELSSLKRQVDATTELQVALKRRAEAVEPAAKAALEAEIKALCRELGREESAFDEGQVMSDEDQTQAETDIHEQNQQKMKLITRQAMERAQLERAKVPPGQ